MRGGIDWDQMIADYRDGATFEELSRRWGKSSTAIREAMVKAGVKLEDGRARRARGLAAYRDRRHAALRARDAWVVEVYTSGHTITETAEITGVARTQVGRIIKRTGVSRPRGPASDR